MKKWIAFLSVLVLSFSACAVQSEKVEASVKEDIVQEVEMEEQSVLSRIQNSVNLKHESIVFKDMNIDKFLRNPLEETEFDPYLPNMEKSAEYDAQTTLNTQQLEEDVEYLFQNLKDTYGLYDYFGGEVRFDEAKRAVLSDLRGESFTAEQLEQSLLKNLSFVKDGHFLINRKYGVKKQIPFFFREVVFTEIEGKYYNADGKIVESIDGYTLESIMKTSLSEDGKLIYYPVLLKECGDTKQAFGKEQYVCEEKLTVNYSDGTVDVLSAEPFNMYHESTGENYQVEQYDNVSVLKVEELVDNGKRQLESLMTQWKQTEIQVLDLRSCIGGSTAAAKAMLSAYTGQSLPSDTITLDAWKGLVKDKDEKITIENDETLVILTGKCTSSAAEDVIAMVCQLSNTIVIGENTNGCRYGGGFQRVLPNSGIVISAMLNQIYVPCADNYEELCGFYPDIWVPANEINTILAHLLP